MKTRDNVVSDVVIAGGGPAGLMLALLLGRQGVDLVVIDSQETLERHFRGESMVPDSVWMLKQAGLLEDLEALGVRRARRLEIYENNKNILKMNFSEFKNYSECFPMEIPQTLLLQRIFDELSEIPNVKLLQGYNIYDLVQTEDGRYNGVVVNRDSEDIVIYGRLIVGADGRYSAIRNLAGFAVSKTPLARDVLWLSVPYPEGWERDVYRVLIQEDRHVLVLPTHPDSLRVGFNIPKGGIAQLRQGGIELLYQRIRELSKELGDTVEENIRGWSDTTVLDVFTAQVPQWCKDGIVLIGDAAHTLSPVLGHGVNHALQDSFTLANIIMESCFSNGEWNISNSRLDALLIDFQLNREPLIEASRSLQTRQEKLFALKGRKCIVRKLIYTMLGKVRPLRTLVLGNAYFTILQD